jgi:hypothetical protein
VLTTRGLVYRARGARDVLACDPKYRISAGFKQKAAKSASFTRYGELYQRVTRVAEARAAEMSCAYGEPLHTRILGHVWTYLPGGSHDFPMAAVVTELSCSKGERAEGEARPTLDALLVPGGTAWEEFSRIASQPTQEFYNEYDVAVEPGTNA